MPSSLQWIYAPPVRRSDWAVALLRAALLALAAWLIWRTAWVSDDAAITLRTVLNLLTGHGARFNIDERVQAYTHPLWFGLLTLGTAMAGNALLAAAWLGIALSVAALIWLLRLAVNPWQGLLAVGALLASTAFMQFSTSGLENPLSHVLILAAATALIRIHGLSADAPNRARWLRGFFLCAGLLYLSRPDLVVLLAPCALQLLATRDIAPRIRVRALFWAATPVLVWTIFSLLYYGFPFPNTAYAKLGTGIAQRELWRQGLHYFGNTLTHDPLTLVVSALALPLAPFVRRWGWGWALGVALYLVYVASIGGDFMAGRFFSVPMLAGALMLARAQWPWSDAARWLACGLLALAIPALAWHNIRYTLHTAAKGRPPSICCMCYPYGIADEQSCYFGYAALATVSAPDLALFRPDSYRTRTSDQALNLTCGGLGFMSIRSGPGTHILDTCALAEPLLARLPVPYMGSWCDEQPQCDTGIYRRIGHFDRAVPAGYEESIKQDANLLTDPALHGCYERIRSITRAPLLEGRRLREVVRANLTGARCLKPNAPY